MPTISETPHKVTTIIKRDGSKQPYDYEKVINAIRQAFKATRPLMEEDKLESDTLMVANCASVLIHGTATSDTRHTEEVQDIIEEVLMEFGAHDVAKAFILYREEHRNLRAGKIATDIVGTYLDKSDWRVQENSNSGYCYASLMNHAAGTVIANYCLENVYTRDVANAHIDGDIHLHDLSAGVVPYCAGWSIRDVLMKGFIGKYGRANAGPAKHLDTALLQAANFLCTLQTEWAGAQAFNSFDTFMAPFVRNDSLDYEQVKQRVQQFVFGLNIASRYGQCPFTNLTFDLSCPEDMKDQPVIIGGVLQDNTYGNYQKEMDMINKAFIEVMLNGDHDGRIFSFPIPTYNITKDFPWDSEIAKLLFKMTGKLGAPYFQNFISTGLNPRDVRSLCCRLSLDLETIRKHTGGLFGAGDQTGCYSDDTEVLTKNRGWILFKDLTLDDTLFTRNKDGGLEYHRPTQLFEYDYDGDLIHFETDRLDLLVTPNHNMAYVTKDSHTQRLIRADKYSYHSNPIPANVENTTEYVGTFTLPAVESSWTIKSTGVQHTKVWEPLELDSKLWLSFLGWYLSEGCCDNDTIAPSHGYRVRITQVKEDGKCLINNLLSKLPWNYSYKENNNSFVICNKQLWDYVKQFGDCYHKHIPHEILYTYSKEELLCLLESLMFGDGAHNKVNGSNTYYTASKQLAEDVQLLTILCGKNTHIRVRGPRAVSIKGRYYPAEKCHPSYELIISDSKCRYVRPDKIKREHYTGKVYCCEVTNHVLLVRRNNKYCWCGNSIGVCSINIPRIAYLAAKTDDPKDTFYKLLDNRLNLCKKALEAKRREVNKNFDNGLMPYSQEYLPKKFTRHFSTIGVIGFNEACRMLFNKTIADKECINFTLEVLHYILDKCAKFTEETGNMYNAEAVPGEGLAYRFAKIDKKKYPDIITAGTDDAPYYTNSSQLPVDYTSDPFEALELQEELQSTYSSGTVLHFFIGECIDDEEVVAKFVKSVCERSKIPYFSLTPEFSICPKCGYIRGIHETCPNHC